MSAPTISDARRRLIAALGSARPSHEWTPFRVNSRGITRAGCSRCPQGSLFQEDQSSHPYVIEEEP